VAEDACNYFCLLRFAFGSAEEANSLVLHFLFSIDRRRQKSFVRLHILSL
jgi:hypothetical protein